MGGKRCHASTRTLAKRNDARVVWAMDALVECLIEGEAALERGEYSHAVVAFTRALEAAPAESAIALMLANAHRLAGDTIASRAVLLSAFALAPPAQGATSLVIRGAGYGHGVGLRSLGPEIAE